MILHITDRESWRTAREEGSYRGDTLDTEGFIHCSTPEQVIQVANARFPGRTDLILLGIDPDRVTARIVYENLEGGEALFPHVYGPLNLDAVIRTFAFEPDPSGHFRLPDGAE